LVLTPLLHTLLQKASLRLLPPLLLLQVLLCMLPQGGVLPGVPTCLQLLLLQLLLLLLTPQLLLMSGCWQLPLSCPVHGLTCCTHLWQQPPVAHIRVFQV
jgi:hypothetical protein